MDTRSSSLIWSSPRGPKSSIATTESSCAPPPVCGRPHAGGTTTVQITSFRMKRARRSHARNAWHLRTARRTKSRCQLGHQCDMAQLKVQCTQQLNKPAASPTKKRSDASCWGGRMVQLAFSCETVVVHENGTFSE